MAQSSNLSAFANNLNSLGSPVLPNIFETTTVSATAATGNVYFDVFTQSVLYYTTNASANWTLNVRGNSTTTLGSVMAIGQTVTIAFLVTQGSTGYTQTGFQVDGAVITPKWLTGTIPSASTNAIDVYSIAIIKTGSSSFTALISQSKFA
jgi:hypothetical protein